MTAEQKLLRPNSLRVELLGMSLYLLGIGLMAVMDASAKWLTASYAIVQLIFFESLFGTIPAVLALSREGAHSLLTKRWPLLIVRAILALGTMGFFFGALRFLPLAEVTMIFLVAPLLATLLAGLILHEQTSVRHLAATAVGLLGALLIIRPASWSSSLAVLMPLGSALCYATSLVMSRSLARTEASAAIVVYEYAILLSFSSAFLPAKWSTPTFADLLIFAVMGISGGLSVYCRTRACRYAPASLLAPLDYTGMIWAILLGVAFWRELPHSLAYLGAVLIAASGIYIVRRQT